MAPSWPTRTLNTALRNFSNPTSQTVIRAWTHMPCAMSIRATSPARGLSTGARKVWGKGTSTSISRQWPTVLLGKLDQRPSLDMVRTRELNSVRGMKVRSSVKKLCEGCKVRRTFPYPEFPCRKANGCAWDRASGGKAMSTSYARRIRNISSGKGEGWKRGCMPHTSGL